MGEAPATQALTTQALTTQALTIEALNDAQAASLGARIVGSLRREGGGPRRVRRLARAEGLLPLVDHAAGRAPGRFGRIASALSLDSARTVSHALADEGVAHAFTKGVALAPRYGAPWLRPMSDADLVVRARDLDRVRRVVPGLGYREVTSSEVEAIFVSPGPSVLASTLDVHTRLGYIGQFEFPVEEMLARAGTRDGLPVFAAEDELLALAAHVARHRMRGIGRSECDIAVLTFTSRVDWDAVTERARAWGLRVAAWVAFSCARRAFGARVPADVLGRLRPSALQEAYLRLWLDLARVSPYRLSRRRFDGLHRRAMLFLLWPALSDGLPRGAWFVARYSVRNFAKSCLRSRIEQPQMNADERR